MTGQKPTRGAQMRRRAIEGSFHPAFRAWAKVAGWGYRKPNAYRIVGDWFVGLHPVIWTDAERAELWALIKPRAIDDLVGRILGLGALDRVPLSHRTAGPYCLVRPMLVGDIEQGGEPDRMVAAGSAFATAAVAHAEDLSLGAFIAFAADDRPPGEVAENHVAALILAGRDDEAAALCDRAIAARQSGSPARMTAAGEVGGFFALACAWLAGQRH